MLVLFGACLYLPVKENSCAMSVPLFFKALLVLKFSWFRELPLAGWTGVGSGGVM